MEVNQKIFLKYKIVSIIPWIYIYIAWWVVKIIMYVVCSKSIANFEFPQITYIRFSIFCAVMLVLIPLTYANKFGHFECPVNFWQLFCLDVFWLVFDFCLFSFSNKKKSQVAGSGEYGDCGQTFAHKQRYVSGGVIVVQKPIFVLPQIRAFLADCFA